MSVLGLYPRSSPQAETTRPWLMVVAALVVIGVVAVASFLAGSFFTGAAIGYAAAEQDANQQLVAVANHQLEAFGFALMRFNIEHGRFPNEDEGLQSLRLFLTKGIPADPWGRDYIYSVDGESVTVASAGPDEDSSEDDIRATLP